MLNVVDSPKGIDVQVRKFQEKLFSSLMDKWTNVLEEEYQSYGRCYRNKKDNGYVAEVYTGFGEYKEVYWDDTLAAISFFGINSPISHEIIEKVDAHLVFFVDLEKIKPSLTNRADEEVRLDILNSIETYNFGFKFISVDLWLENVLREYPGSYRDQGLKVVDMHPVHCFRLNFTLNYNKNNCF